MMDVDISKCAVLLGTTNPIYDEYMNNQVIPRIDNQIFHYDDTYTRSVILIYLFVCLFNLLLFNLQRSNTMYDIKV